MLLTAIADRIQTKVRGLFYYHGMFCASHPFAIISLVITIAFITCYPLTNIPLPGNAPLMLTTPVEGYEKPSAPTPTEKTPADELNTPRWYLGAPEAYIQQVVVKSVVSPWKLQSHIQTDAFRGPIQQAFDLVEQINNFKYNDGHKELTVSDLCLRVSETRSKHFVKGVLPEYNCLMVSPADLWHRDKTKFQEDGDIMKTIFKKFSPPMHTPPYLKDVLFGVSSLETGVKKYFVRNRQRVITYAVTIVMKEYNAKFLQALTKHLHSAYPMTSSANNVTVVDHMTHVYYKDLNYFVEYTPLLVTYTVLFMYIYFSVCKIEMVKSKWGLAFSAVVTVIASLLMSVSICLLFGLTPSLNGSEIFPYLVVIIGLENVLVVTKSVVSTPAYLDVKLRVAQGISKEGWYIFKYMVTELLILAVGFLTFVPAIQEFCAFAVVGLLTDFFLQMFFFTTVLSIDIRRMELSDLHKQNVQHALNDNTDFSMMSPNAMVTDMSSGFKSRGGQMSSIKASALKTPSPIRIPSGGQTYGRRSPSPTLGSISGDRFVYEPPAAATNLPRRVRFLNFWARTRVVQKTVMVCVVFWILLFMYKAAIAAFLASQNGTAVFDDEMATPVDASLSPTLDKLMDGKRAAVEKSSEVFNENEVIVETFKSQVPSSHMNHYHAKHGIRKAEENGLRKGVGENGESSSDGSQVAKMLEHTDMEPWKKLSYNQWPILFGYYNMSLQGKYITMLPTIPVSIAVSGEMAVRWRHHNEHKLVSQLSKYYNNAANMYYGSVQDNGDNDSATSEQSLNLVLMMNRISVYPRNAIELILTILCCLATFVMFTYFMVYLYKCMCPKNYSQWRASWYKRSKNKRGYYKQIRETVPLNLEGHKQEIECITTDGPLVVSTCLGGYIKVWDANSGECVTTIVRKSPPPPPVLRKPIPGRNINDSDADLYAEFHGDDPTGKRSAFDQSPLEKMGRVASGSSLSQSPTENYEQQVNRSNSSQSFTDNGVMSRSSFNQSSTGRRGQMVGSTYSCSPPGEGALQGDLSSIRGTIDMFRSDYGFIPQVGHSTERYAQRQSSVTHSPLTSPTLRKAKHTRFKSADWSTDQFEDIGPDLSSTIETDFTALAKEQRQKETRKQQHQQGASVILGASHTSSNYSSRANSIDFIHQQDSSSGSLSFNSTSLNQSFPDVSNQSDPCRTSAISPGILIPSQNKSGGDAQASAPRDIPSRPRESVPSPGGGTSPAGYDFRQFVEPYYREHAELMVQKKAYLEAKRRRSSSFGTDVAGNGGKAYCLGESPPDHRAAFEEHQEVTSAVWCLACHQNLIVAGCGNGRIEFWDGLSGQMKCHFSDNKVGVTALCFVANKITVARLNGTIDFLEIETFVNSNKPPNPTVHNRGHVRQPSNSSLGGGDMKVWDDIIHCNLVSTSKAHQRPINLLQSEGGRVVSASQDHTLKVYRLEDSLCLYTLYGHNGSVSALHLDKTAPLAAASGAEDGTVRLWDLFTGSCVHKLHGHASTVTSLTCTPSYVISVGVDDRLCIWERSKGALLNWVQMDAGFCNGVAMLTSHLMVSGGQGCLRLWDVCKGEILRNVSLGDQSVFVKQIHVIANSAVVCDYGNQLRVVHFPSVLEKVD